MTQAPTAPAPPAAVPRRSRGARLFAALHPSYLAWAIPGPIFHKEMWMAGRRGGTYAIRALYTGALLAIVALTFVSMRPWGGGSTTARLQQIQGVAPSIAFGAAWFQFFALALAAIIFAAPSICDEKRAGTLGTLLTTPLRAWQIVLGKLASTCTQLVILALVSAPVLLALRLFGGVTAEFVLGSQCVTIATALLAANIALYVSIGAKRAPAAAGTALVLFFVSLGAGPLLLWGVTSIDLPAGVAARLLSGCVPGTGPLLAPIIEGVLRRLSGAVGPGAYLFSTPVVGMSMLYQELRPGMLPAWTTRAGWLAGTAFGLAGSAVLFFASTFRLRRVLRAESDGGAPIPAPAPSRTARPGAQPPPLPGPAGGAWTLQTGAASPPTRPHEAVRVRGWSREVGDHPVFWREFRQPLFRSSVQRLLAIGFLSVLLLFVYWRVGWDNLGEQAVQMPVGTLGTLMLVLLGIFSSSALIAGERESRTWEALLASPLSAWEIVTQKFLGSLRKAWLVLGTLTAHFVLMTLLFRVHPLTIVFLAFAVIPPLLGVTATGVLFSTVLPKSVRAAAANFALWVGVWAALPLVVGIASAGIGRADTMISIAMFPNPVGMTAVSLTGLAEFEWSRKFSLARWDFDFYGIGDVPALGFVFLLALYTALYAGVAWGALQMAARHIAVRTGRAR
ncbi:MAG: ABC transporter permease subunit [Planctomycetota bacterium]|nr:ABC transporter permease subunit [Planctomycetota bacterium]